MINNLFRNAKSMAIEKIAGLTKQLFSHTTTADNLKKILLSGELKALEDIAKKSPKKLINVESGFSSILGRQNLTAAEALVKMQKNKDVGKVFLTRNGYVPAYGNHIITKNMYSPEKRLALNTIPEEYVTKNSINLQGPDTQIYVPDESLNYWKDAFPKYQFNPLTAYEGKTYGPLHRVSSLPQKAVDSAMSSTALDDIIADRRGLASMAGGAISGMAGNALVNPNGDLSSYAAAGAGGAALGLGSRHLSGLGGFIGTGRQDLSKLVDDNLRAKTVKGMFGSNAVLAGSSPLGIALDSSDVDVFMPYRTRMMFDRAAQQVQANYPELIPSRLNSVRPDKQVFSGNVGGKDIDLVLGHGPKAIAFRDAFNAAKKKLTDVDRASIIAEKTRLKHAWILQQLRYKMYKNRVAKDLGLKQHYF